MTPPSPSLKKNFQWVLAGNVVNSACQWSIVALLAKVGSTQMLGTYLMAMAVVMPVTTFSKLHMRSIFVTDARNDHSFGDYFQTGLLAGLVGLAIITFWSLAGGYDSRFMALLLLVGLARSLDNPSELFLGYCQKRERMEFVGLGMMLRGITSLAVVVAGVALTGSLLVAAAALVAAALFRQAAFEYPVARRVAGNSGEELTLKTSLSWPTVRVITAMGVPLGLVMFLNTLNPSLIRLVLEANYGKDQLAYFGAAAYPLMVGTIVVGALGQSAAPRLSRFYAADRQRFWFLLGRMAGLGVLLGAGVLGGVWLVGRPALEILYSPEYGVYHREFVIMAAGSVFLFAAGMLGYGLTAARKFNLQFMGSAIICLVAALLAWALIPGGGIRAAAWTYFWVALAQLLNGVILLAVVRRAPDPGPPETSGEPS
jgi:O-antigen/teichoic acid export membrane protein